MRTCILVVGALVLASLLTWLGLSGASAGTSVADEALRALDEYAMAESMLHRDLLSARAGLLRNYDAFTRETARLGSAVAQLRAVSIQDPQFAAGIERLAQRVEQQEQWAEQFKTSNALLQNSLAYFDVASAELTGTNAPAPLAQQVSALAAAMLHLTLDTSPAAVAAVDTQLVSIAAAARTYDVHAIHALQAHARLLRTLLPQTEGVLKSVFVVAGGSEPADLRSLALAHRQDAEARATSFRYSLLGLSLLLAAALLGLGINLLRRAEALRKRAAIEHILAGISTRFINSRPADVTSLIEEALAQLGMNCGADRAYFLVAGEGSEAYTWSRGGKAYPQSWPARAMLVAHAAKHEEGEMIHVSSVRALPSGPGVNALVESGTQAWLSVRGRAKGREALLGLDFATPGRKDTACEPALLQMAFNAVASVVDRNALERDRSRLEANLQQARRMETVGSFASGIAHNFNNIIGAILGFAETAQAYLKPGGRQRAHAAEGPGSRVDETLTEIRNAGERARKLVEQILAFARRSPIPRTPTSLKAVIAEARSLLEASLPSTIHIVVHQSPQPVIIDAQPTQLQQVILNICSNAAQAMDGAGVIQIEMDVRGANTAPRLDHGKLGSGPHAVIAITDAGRGMDGAIRERMFEPFFTTRVAGNGLGLATVREIVLEHGGALRVSSSPGAGTRMEIWLPALHAGQLVDTTVEVQPPRRGRGEAILVLEADRDRLLRHEEVIAALGYEPVGFTQPAEAANACQAAPARFDAALLCGHGPAVDDALRLLAPFRKGPADLSIIVATPSARALDARSLARAGVSAVVGQPFIASELAATLARHVRAPLRT